MLRLRILEHRCIRSCAARFMATVLAGQDPLRSVKDLCVGRLRGRVAAVGRLDAAPPNIEAEQYRVFCLVALGRVDEADKAVETLLTARPSTGRMPPRRRRGSRRFSQVRRRIGPDAW